MIIRKPETNVYGNSLLLVFLLCGLVASLGVNAASPIKWTPNKLEVSQSQGTLATYDLEFEVQESANELTAYIVQELQPWVTVSPMSFSGLASGDSALIFVSVNLPVDAPLGLYEGVVQLRSSTEGQPQRVIPRPFPVSLNITELVDDGLPPDPGEAGKVTLLGIDVDEDGVRDDIQRYIYFQFVNQEAVRAALTEVAKQYQLLLANASDPELAFSNATRMARHGECLDFFEGEGAADILAALKAEVLNTEERALAYIQYNDSLGGQIIIGRPLATWESSCAFETNSIGAN